MIKIEFKFILLLVICFQRASLTKSPLTFFDGFSFGVATSAYQIEGAWNESNKGISIWDHISHDTNFIEDGTTGDITCDSYHKIDEDIELLRSLGVNHYRFSIAWTRILPTGLKNEINWEGVAYYDYLITKLLEYEIEPWVTIYHFDHPYSIELIGGWFQEKMADYLSEYADFLFDIFGERVKTWITINEPWSICVTGIAIVGSMRPNGTAEYICGENVLKAHAAIWDVYNKKYRATQNGKLSMAFSLQAYLPATDSAEDIEAAERVNQFAFGWFVHPIVYGNYPQQMIDTISYYSKVQGFGKSRLPELSVIDLLMLKGSYDFIGLNNYDTFLVSADNKTIDKNPSYDNDLGAKIITDPGWNTTYSIDMKAKGLGVILKWIKDTYNNPEIRITEQGIPDRTGELVDSQRHSYLVANMVQLLHSIYEDQVNVTGYTFWSLLDNFEWNKGLSVKYGLVNVNFDDPERPRTPKLSSLTFSLVVKTRSLLNLT